MSNVAILVLFSPPIDLQSYVKDIRWGYLGRPLIGKQPYLQSPNQKVTICRELACLATPQGLLADTAFPDALRDSGKGFFFDSTRAIADA